jgi:hypothetical protein
MNLDAAFSLVQETEQRMNELYQKPVFDEWAIVARAEDKFLLLRYLGPRKENFQKSFGEDTQELRQRYREGSYGIGDYEFARHGYGTKTEAFVVIGQGLFLLCNNTSKAMAEVAADPLWLGAQAPFVELCDKFRADPVIHP